MIIELSASGDSSHLCHPIHYLVNGGFTAAADNVYSLYAMPMPIDIDG